MIKKILISLCLITLLGMSLPVTSLAQDAPNANVTKRRPDRPPNYSPTPLPSSTTKPLEVKQVETSNKSFFAELWNKIKIFFQKFSN